MKKIVFSWVVAPFVLLTCLTSVVQATVFDWKYAWNSGGMLSGTLEGLLQGDGNTVNVTSIMGSYTGPNASDFDLAYSGAFAWPSGPGIVTLDGSFFNLYTGTALFQNMEFFIDSGSNGAKLFHPIGTVIENEGIDPIRNSWVASEHWSLTEVPEPSILALLSIGLIGIGAARKLK